MKFRQPTMSPLDIVVLLKIVTHDGQDWYQSALAEQLFISQSEISKSLARSRYAGLLDQSGKQVMRLNLMDFLQSGIRYAFPQQPGPFVRGVPTAHSMEPLSREIQSEDNYVWSSAYGALRGQAIVPLYSSAVKAVKHDQALHELLALVDALRVGKTRERNMAIDFLKTRVC